MIRRRLSALFVLLGTASAGLTARLYQVQVVNHRGYAAQSAALASRVIPVTRQRGSLLDRDGRLLAISVVAESVYARPAEVTDPDEASSVLSSILGMSARAVRDRLDAKSGAPRFVWLKRKVDPMEADQVRRLGLEGIGLQAEEKRVYPEGELASQVLGVVDAEGRGVAGAEQFLDEELRRPAEREFRERDARGRQAPAAGSRAALDGGGPQIRLTLSVPIQHLAEVELSRAMAETQARWGAVMVQDPRTGEILALANRPTFDGNNLSPASVRHLANPCLSWYFEPGSTFKIVAAAAALEERLVSPDEMFQCEHGRFKVADVWIHDHHETGWGALTFREVVQNSSNIGMAKLGIRLGKGRLYRAARDFGFGTPTGLGFVGEAAGRMVSPRSRAWSGTTLAMMSFGQGVGVTAIQLLGAYSCLANGGVLLSPQLVLGEPPVPVRRVVSTGTAERVMDLLIGAVERGTGVNAQVIGYRVAGKTGTAQKAVPGRRTYLPDRYLASFCGYLPADRPRVTILVILDEPRFAHQGGQVAAPVFSRVAAGVMQALNVPGGPSPVPKMAMRP